MATTFDSTKKSLKDLLDLVGSGKLKLPDFQRGWVWDDEGIRSLLASISESFPVGALMTLTTGGPVSFKARPIEGASDLARHVHADELLLDGQQRMTSLYQATIRREVIDTVNVKQQKIKRWYYIDMRKAVDPAIDREEAIIGVPEDRVVREHFGRDIKLDLSTPENEYEALMFPVNRVFDNKDWGYGFEDYWLAKGENKRALYREFETSILRNFDHYQLPVITLGKDTPKQAVCLVFEKVNTGGKKLDAFELLTAIFASDGFELRKDWYGEHSVKGRLTRLAAFPTLKNIANTDFLQAVSLLHTKEKRTADVAAGKVGKEPAAVSCTRASILSLPLGAYTKHADAVEAGFIKAAKFLRSLKIYWVHDVPYKTQLVPLAAVLSEIGDLWDQDAVRRRVARWFWCGVFGELYGSAVETRFAKDLVEVSAWLRGGEEPSTVKEAIFRADRLDTMRTRLSAAYKGLHALLMQEGAQDFRSGVSFDDTVYFDEKVDIHHVFPQKWCKDKGITPKLFDTIVNKTPLTAKTNRIVGGNAPSYYLDRLEASGSIKGPRLDDCIRSHLVDPGLLRADDFHGSYAARREALLRLVEKAMGLAVYRGTATDEAVEEVEDDAEEVGAWPAVAAA